MERLTPDQPISAADVASVYLRPPSSGAKRQKQASPLDLGPILTAAKRLAKSEETATRKALGANPNDELRPDGQRTGLCNLGATCYMNSLVQSLFMTHAFRAGIYSWSSTAAAEADGEAASAAQPAAAIADNVCFELQRLFVALHHSEATSYDPTALTDALSLDTSVQQDAQEFNKLLLSLIETHLRRSPEPALQSLVQSTFRGEPPRLAAPASRPPHLESRPGDSRPLSGESCYRTVCARCERPFASSATRHPLYELELRLKPSGGTALQESLLEYVCKEELDGVECGHCSSKQNATRNICLASLPPVLSLQLLRFVYDMSTGGKKKASLHTESCRTLPSPRVEARE